MKKWIERLITAAGIAILVGIFCYQVAYGYTASYNYGLDDDCDRGNINDSIVCGIDWADGWNIFCNSILSCTSVQRRMPGPNRTIILPLVELSNYNTGFHYYDSYKAIVDPKQIWNSKTNTLSYSTPKYTGSWSFDGDNMTAVLKSQKLSYDLNIQPSNHQKHLQAIIIALGMSPIGGIVRIWSSNKILRLVSRSTRY
jgi:hypothetical protein